MSAHVFTAGTYLPDEGKLSDYEQWVPFKEWFVGYMGYEPDDDNREHVEVFEAFYAGRIYQIELTYNRDTSEAERKLL